MMVLADRRARAVSAPATTSGLSNMRRTRRRGVARARLGPTFMHSRQEYGESGRILVCCLGRRPVRADH